MTRIEALEDLNYCVEVDNTAGIMGEGDDSERYCAVIGNVSLRTLRTLGFDIPKEKRTK